jgi:ankyrin repeat protein
METSNSNKPKWSMEEWYPFLRLTLTQKNGASNEQLSTSLQELKEQNTQAPYVRILYNIIRYWEADPVKLAIFFPCFPPATLLVYPHVALEPLSRANGLFHTAAYSENHKRIEIVQLLLDHGLDLNWLCNKSKQPQYNSNARDNFKPEDAGFKHRETSLHVAAGRGDKDLVRYPLDHGANTTMQDGFNYTAKKRAEVNQQQETAKMFDWMDNSIEHTITSHLLNLSTILPFAN